MDNFAKQNANKARIVSHSEPNKISHLTRISQRTHYEKRNYWFHFVVIKLKENIWKRGIITYTFTITTFHETEQSLVGQHNDRCSVTQFCVFSSVGSLLILSFDYHSNASFVSANCKKQHNWDTMVFLWVETPIKFSIILIYLQKTP